MLLKISEILSSIGLARGEIRALPPNTRQASRWFEACGQSDVRILRPVDVAVGAGFGASLAAAGFGASFAAVAAGFAAGRAVGRGAAAGFAAVAAAAAAAALAASSLT